MYSLTISPACASDSNIPQTAPKAPGDTGAVQPPSTPAVQPTPKPKPGFKPLNEATKGAYVESGDFYLGLTFALLLVVGGIVINRP